MRRNKTNIRFIALVLIFFMGSIGVKNVYSAEPVGKTEVSVDKAWNKKVELEGIETAKEILKQRQLVASYNPNIPLSKDLQKFLYNKCEESGVDYKLALALMATESDYKNGYVSDSNDYGLFQINKINHKWLAEKVGTPNTPLDPYVNIQWGVSMLKDLTATYIDTYSGDKLKEAVLSSYNKGIAGYKEYGPATRYIARFDKKTKWIASVWGQSEKTKEYGQS